MFQELSLGSDGSEASRNRNKVLACSFFESEIVIFLLDIKTDYVFCDKGSLQHQYGHVPSGAFTAPSLHGSERRPNLNVGDFFGSYPWGYLPTNHPSGGYQDQSFGYGHNSSLNTYSHLMVCWFCYNLSPVSLCLYNVCFLFNRIHTVHKKCRVMTNLDTMIICIPTMDCMDSMGT